ncbi:uncharacterized protein L969DRAFT_503373 [Mixia osmundae IAM 14324]|uniref:Uncharacterized protein n=1 Tax=Mixia osmundae (strain CBS 9802 / IAM 14324 / JCM 22182 / KY 12970) TaxID=764103 RepID=G7E6Z5_MIXOS|nr:uncharacterized protein L969DRAFT_503373 [Mixia osmundae IAM 14324]KEI39012.1 hypothetical protein L969DRAFT_503373 [Mixia osmundae IAM 14324]GAA98605.1 hypothetical protein E5Q_05292 [Mixia osmundae IAM 14324]
MFSKSLKTMIPAALALCLATLSLGASIDARDANTLERRHTGPYTWCGLQTEYLPGKVLGLYFYLNWYTNKYVVSPGEGMTFANFEPAYMDHGSLNDANFVLKSANNYDVDLQAKVGSDGDIQGIALANLKIGDTTFSNVVSLGFQCSSDPQQQNKVTIPRY